MGLGGGQQRRRREEAGDGEGERGPILAGDEIGEGGGGQDLLGVVGKSMSGVWGRQCSVKKSGQKLSHMSEITYNDMTQV